MKLANDICRCVGFNCDQRLSCERFIQNERGSCTTPFSLSLCNDARYESKIEASREITE